MYLSLTPTPILRGERPTTRLLSVNSQSQRTTIFGNQSARRRHFRCQARNFAARQVAQPLVSLFADVNKSTYDDVASAPEARTPARARKTRPQHFPSDAEVDNDHGAGPPEKST